ncbi:family 2 glycosyl transferase [Alteromonas sp. KS69]|jgi:hypothetical protein|uniref:Glycosyl transferase, family 2 n=1 Tax=Alteromonas naphthalenivorans TaxID=715451 RepID=F5Z9U3_ALTNA|nr:MULTISPECIES: galactosyltransferase-related protein [Alteromonas]MBB66527.1 family 2 glycosyl transferase [Rickettsiales bacterium]PHS50333.1 MAG: family 2 glycosyl transferase [Alteromonas sp.]AEF02098.1 glycosyl transferase, family 2 [Alteromonas naphthalenivorans]MBO7924509.1 family 2 glycosyl transferase [Alteromonas sp. K632G]RUP75919.1 family 2 glycosyl transferase [Alteromonas sp. KS69]|tara:strand:+ start:3287 stop:4114 length:828 start_codon:yes stop_codon:yes gene_type:complete
MNQHSSISVIITVKSRIEAFTAFVNRLEKAELPPRELIVVWMGRPSEHSLYKSEVFNIVHRFDNCEELDIAGARNRGLAAATSSLCLFMNVESIFSPQLFKCLQNSWSQSRVITSKISCVSEDISLTDYSDLIEHTNNNPETKENGSDCAFSIRQNSTLFCIGTDDLKRIGGFDEGYRGYGLNDEDFFQTCINANLDIERIDLITFIKERENYRCPVNHLIDFVSNAGRYKQKWGEYPCPEILQDFADKGYINQSFQKEELHILRLPTQEEQYFK